MTINTYLSIIESKNKLSKEEEQRQNHGYGERFDGCQMGGCCRDMGEEIRGLRSTNSQTQVGQSGVGWRDGEKMQTTVIE